MKLIKPVTKLGNSSKVLLPKEWMGGTARVELIEKPIDIKDDVLKILSSYLKDILGIYLTGSYARKEQTRDSDIDILVITNKIDKRIKKGRYEIIMISEENLNMVLKTNIIPLLPMIKESRAILNERLIEKYKDIKPNKENIKSIIEITKSSRKVCKAGIKLAKEMNSNVSDGLVYSLVLGLRTVYMINSLKKNRIPTTKGLKDLVMRITGSEESYNAYSRSKNNQKVKETITPKIAEKLNDYIGDNIM